MILISYIVSIILINNYIKEKKLISSNTGFNHQSFVNNSAPLTGGIYLFFPVFFIFLPNYLLFLFTFSILFLIGLFSDLKIFVSAKKRFLMQLVIILFFTFFLKLEVIPTKINFFDDLIQNTYWSYIFTVFCLMILINGSNFIDGLNGLLLGYFCLIIFLLLKLNLFDQIGFVEKNLFYFSIVALFILILNISNKLFLGDSGAYSVSFLIGFVLIKIYNLNNDISPYFIILLLWYPCFENLFSIIRKKFYKNDNPLEPDTEHFHQKLFFYLKKRFKLTNFRSNILSSLIILSFNSLIFYSASMAISHTIYQLSLVGISIAIYLITYVALHKVIKKDNF